MRYSFEKMWKTWITCAIAAFILSVKVCEAQKEAYVWYFSHKLGLDFNYSPPVLLTDGQIIYDIGCESAASISDEDGNLLFYTNGVSVWNRNHALMPNGTELWGNCTTTQTLIVPQPNTDDLYYIFTASPQGDFASELSNSPIGFHYSIVDLSLNNGLGDVALKNILLSTSTTEKIAGVKHTNGHDVWVVMHEWNNNAFRAYLVTENGIDLNPVVSLAGSIHSGEIDDNNAIGQMKFSPSGETLALALRNSKIAEIFKFDLVSGKIRLIESLTNIVNLNRLLYGVEFSPSGRYLYLTDAFQNIIQFDLQANPIRSSKIQIANQEAPFLDNPLTLQLGPDGKIYVAKDGIRYMGIIHSPDSGGVACDYQSRGVVLDDSVDGFSGSLPNFISSYFYNPELYPQSPYFQMPNIFTPNDDGYNDKFVPLMKYNVESYNLVLYNRWGDKIYQTYDLENGWDGGDYPSGIYYWQVFYTGINGNNYSQKGVVHLLR